MPYNVSFISLGCAKNQVNCEQMMASVSAAGHTVAAHFRADPINRRELRAYAVDEVLRTNGQISFDDALDLQRQIDSDE